MKKNVLKKCLSLILAAASAVTLFAGCSSGGTAASNGGKQDDSSVKILDVVWFSDGKEGDSFKKLADQYTESHPNIKFNMVTVPYNDLESKIKNMLNGGQAPALARVTNLGPFENQLVDLGQYVSDKQAFINNFGEGLKFVYDDKILGAPMDITANGLIYNKTAFDKAGVKVPQSADQIWTWDELEQDLKTVMAKGGCKYGMVFDKTAMRLSTLFYEMGGSMLSTDLKTSNFNTTEIRNAVTLFKKLHDDKIIPNSVWLGSENPNNLFRTGQVAMHFAGSWMIANYKDQIKNFEWGVTYLPKGKVRSSVPGGKYLSAFKGSGKEKEASEFIEWISKPENNAQYCKENLFLSQVKGNESLDYGYGKDFFRIFSDELSATSKQPGAEWGYSSFTALVQNDLRDKMSDVLAGKLTVDNYVTTMDGEITKALKEVSK
ncbi:MAG: sugar ABC transporter substrate-binding protein [Oscillospiraceae bacterium]|jgi:alpha-1,4-digalacturonate transport system substrate-binding protein|nr:sugar ABC transporter substrate-binding protein [Oscillospiraceae bacterium]MCI1991048.1 sugar ABC transporter substrate-binding protein [Oscillospiraceae bacterium]MCI2036115.1 sugar ABC transporter substrate-binding protein [Oscillospiraceae bacterium]